MLKKIFFAGLLLQLTGLVWIPLFAQCYPVKNDSCKGHVQTSLSIHSVKLGTQINYSVYLPPQYYNSTDSFAVIYLLHGLGGDETSWVKRIGIQNVVDSLINCHDMPPVVIIMPDGRDSYYINDYKESFPYADFFEDEFIPDMEKLYKLSPKRNNTIIAGLSMGGYGAVIHCIKHPEKFGTCIALSAAIRTDSQFVRIPEINYGRYFAKLYGDSLSGNKRLTDNWKNNSPFYLLPVSDTNSVRQISWYIDCGLDDPLLAGNDALHRAFIEFKIPHEFRIRPGGHNREYWTSGMADWLIFAGKKIKKLY